MDTTLKIASHLNYLLVPFYYDNDDIDRSVKQITASLTADGLWQQTDISADVRILDHIKGQIYHSETGNEKAAIGYLLQMSTEKKVRQQHGVPTGGLEVWTKNKRMAQFSVRGAEMYLFKTGIGVLAIEVDYGQNETVDNIVEGNYLLKRLRQGGIGVRQIYRSYKIDGRKVREKTAEDTGAAFAAGEKEYVIGFNDPSLSDPGMFNAVVETAGSGEMLTLYHKDETTVPEIIDRLLHGLEIRQGGHDKPAGNGVTLPERILTFSFLLLDKPEEGQGGAFQRSMKETLYYLRKAYRPSYRPTPGEIETDESDEVLRIFENSYWSTSKEACANVVYLTDDERSNSFFTGSYITNVKRGYLFLYIACLHQYYGLLSFARALSDLPADTAHYTQGDIDNLERIKKRIGFFNLKVIFSEVSYITHQQQFYNKMRGILGIEQLMAELEHESENISALIAAYVSEKSEKRAKRFSWIGGIFATLAIVQGMWDLIGKLMVQQDFDAPFALSFPGGGFWAAAGWLIAISGVAAAVFFGSKWLIHRLLSKNKS